MTHIFIRHVLNKSVLQGSEQHNYLFTDHPDVVQECVAEALAFPEDAMLADNVLNEASWEHAVKECWNLLNTASLHAQRLQDGEDLEEELVRQGMTDEVEQLFDELISNLPKLEVGLRAMALSGVSGQSSDAADQLEVYLKAMNISGTADQHGDPRFTCKYDACGEIPSQKFFAIHLSSHIQMHEQANDGTGVPVVCLWSERDESICYSDEPNLHAHVLMRHAPQIAV